MLDAARAQDLVDRLAAHQDHRKCAVCGEVGRRQTHWAYLDAWEQLAIAGLLSPSSRWPIEVPPFVRDLVGGARR